MVSNAEDLKPPRKLYQKIFNLRQLIIFVLGFASGFPLLLTGSTFKLWLSQEKIDIKTIGMMSLVGLAYSLKFAWAPLLDRYHFPFLGRRKTWLIFTQLMLALGLYKMSHLSPSLQLYELAFWAVFVAFMSATQDITIDAYRGEILATEEVGLGSSMSVYGYRVAMWIAGGIMVSFVADTTTETAGRLSWMQFYWISSAVFAGLAVISFFIPEPKNMMAPKTLFNALVEPFTEFFKRENAIYILLFVFTFKLGDQIAGSLLSPFYKSMGYANAEIGFVTKTCGMISTFAGLFAGGVALFKFGVNRCLWIFGIFQAVCMGAFALITFTGPVIWSLATVVILEDFSAGMATAAFITFMSSISAGKYTATQFALLSSLGVLGRTLFSSYAGYLQEYLGWAGFFYFGALMAIPGLIMLHLITRVKSDLPGKLHTNNL